MATLTKVIQDGISPVRAIEMLKEGNKRFLEKMNRIEIYIYKLKRQVMGSFPYAVVLSCIDSRVPVELVFDQGVGDILALELQEIS